MTSPGESRRRRAYQAKAHRDAGARFKKGNLPCHWCGGPADTVDHLIPLHHNGANTPANMVPACRSCNSSRGAKLRTRRSPNRPTRTRAYRNPRF